MGRERPLTLQARGALLFLVSAGSLKVVNGPNNMVFGEVSIRTAYALERRGYAERRWTGGEDGVIYSTPAGEAASNEIEGIDVEDD